MVSIGLPRTTPARVALAVAGALLLGALGASLVAEGVLLTMPLPRSATGRAWRTFGLTSVSTGLAAGLIGFAIGAFESTPIGYGVILGALVGVGGLVLGALAGAVVSLDQYRRDGRLA